MRGKLAKMIRLALIGTHRDVVDERKSRTWMWSTEIRKGQEKNINIVSSPSRRTYQQFKEAYRDAGGNKGYLLKRLRKLAGAYEKFYSQGLNPQLPTDPSGPTTNIIKS